MRYNYDRDRDVLTIKFKEGVPNYPVEYSNGITYLVSRNNLDEPDENVGYIIPTFIKNFNKKFLPMPVMPDSTPFNYLTIKENISRGIDSCVY